MKKFLTMLAVAFSLVGCNKADNIQRNIRLQADNFETYRKFTAVNLRSDKVLMTAEGLLAIKNSDTNNDGTVSELAIIIKTGEDSYKMNYLFLGGEIVYLIEQTENSTTDPYHWEIHLFGVVPEVKVG